MTVRVSKDQRLEEPKGRIDDSFDRADLAAIRISRKPILSGSAVFLENHPGIQSRHTTVIGGRVPVDIQSGRLCCQRRSTPSAQVNRSKYCLQIHDTLNR